MEAENGKPDAENGNPDAEKGNVIEQADSKPIISDLCLRITSFALSLAAMVTIVTSNETKLVKTPTIPFAVPVTSRYSDSPAYIYLVVALSLAISYSLITALATFWVLKKRFSSKSLLKYYLILIANDVVMVGVLAAATGAGGSLGYLGLKGNSHAGWTKICNVFGRFCKLLAISNVLSLVVALIFVVLVVLSANSVHRIARKALN